MRAFFRFWFPCLVLVLAAGLVTLLWVGPMELELMQRSIFTALTVLATILLLGAWLIFFSGLRWWQSLGLLVLGGASLPAAIGEVKFSGDMVPIFRFRWQTSRDQALDAHRQHSADNSVITPLSLGEGKEDYPEYRGHGRDGIVTGPALVRDWSTPPRTLWRQPCGGGFSGFAVVGNATVTMEQRRDQEAIVCYDTATGKERWAHAYDAHFREAMGGDGPRATPSITYGKVFALGALGDLTCLDLATGQLAWQVNILEGNRNLPWAMSGSPLVYDQMVVVNPGVQQAGAGGTLAAYDAGSGKLKWRYGKAKAGYSSPMLAKFGGKWLVLILDAEGLAGHDATSGEELWRYAFPTHEGINVAQPLVLEGDRVFISAGYGHGCAMLQVGLADGKWDVKRLWENRNLRCKFSSPLLHRGYIYGLDEGIFACIDANDGSRKWKGERYGHGQVLLSGDLILVLAESGELVLVEATPDEPRELGRFQALVDTKKTWNPLALAGGKAYIRNEREMACCELAAPTQR